MESLNLPKYLEEIQKQNWPLGIHNNETLEYMCIDKCMCVGEKSVVTYLSGLTETKYEMSLYFFLYTNYHNTSFH